MTDPSADRMEVGNVRLDSAGVLRGVMVNLQGVPVAGAALTLHKPDGRTVRTVTDPFGCFAVDRLSEGTYRLTTGCFARRIRAWRVPTAPAEAGQLALFVLSNDMVRGDVAEADSRPDRPVLRTAVRSW